MDLDRGARDGADAGDDLADHAGWVAAQAGLRLVYAALAMRLVLFVLTLLLGVALMGSRSRGLAEVTVVLTTVLGLVIALTAEVGLVRYVAVPARTGGQGLAIAALVLASVALLIGLVDAVTVLADVRRAIRHGAGGVGSVPTLIAGLASIAMLFTYLGSLNRVATHLGRPELAEQARKAGALLVVVIAAALLMVVILVATHGRPPGLSLVLLIGVVGIAIWMLVACLGATGGVSAALRDDLGVERAFD
ncbi:MAG: hypothetical protein EP329_26950 [Deltaproteobacteria bacterium]|nr:MAG: hypothetical protein EP329_26950 [Deltaproteobacteria bacterium]